MIKLITKKIEKEFQDIPPVHPRNQKKEEWKKKMWGGDFEGE